MSLGQKTLAILLLTVAGLMTVLYAASRVLLLRSFLVLEQTEVQGAVGRARNAVDDDISGLAATTNDYAAWDRSYTFMAHPASDYIAQEFANDTLQGLSINSVLLINSRHEIVFSKYYSLLEKKESEFPSSTRQELTSDPSVLAVEKSLVPISGILATPQGPVLMAACPILTTRRTGPPRGVLVMTRDFNQQSVQHLKSLTRSSLTVRSYTGTLSEPDFQQARESLDVTHDSIVVRPLSNTMVAGYAPLYDIRGKPVLLLRLDASRTVFKQGVAGLHYLLGALGLASLGFGLMTLLLLRQAVLSPLTRLNAEVCHIGQHKTFSSRIQVQGSDELSRLGGAINAMLEALQKSETHFRHVAENIPQVFWLKNALTLEFEFVSLAYEDVWGRSCNDIYANASLWQDAVFAHDRETVDEMLRQQARGKIGSAEYRILHPDGSMRWICDRYFPICDEKGQLVQIAGLAENITEFKRAEQVLLRSQEELEELVRERTTALAKANEALRAEVNERKQAEQALEENMRLASLAASIGASLTKATALRDGLQQCAQAFVDYLGAAFARVWTLNDLSSVLELEASAGIYIHIDGGHARVPLGAMKIGRIAQSRQAHLTNDVAHDPQVSDPTWAKREGMVAFAGCPLIVEGRVVGVVAAFSRKPFSKAVLDCFAAVADQIAQFIHRMWVQDALHASKEHFRQLFATIPVPIWLYDESTLKFLEVNNAAIERYGYSRDEFLSMTIEEVRPVEERGRLWTHLQERPRKSQTRSWRHRAKDGTIFDVEAYSHEVQFTGISAVLVVIQDVTERNRIEVELRHGQKLQAVGELAAGIAHEINTPIQFVGDNVRFFHDAFSNLVKLVDAGERLYAAAEATCPAELLCELKAAREASDIQFLRKEIPLAVDQTLDGVKRVATIVQALKRFSHVDSGPEKTAANLNDALESTLIVARSELKYVADVETKFADLPPVICHLGDLNQVFLNLLVNAAHAIADAVKGTANRGTIRVETRADGDWVVIAISDSGAGIPPEIRDRIFEPFFTTKALGKGTGQGLALARAIVVDRHGGTLTFESEMGKGTTFCVRIPVNGIPLARDNGAAKSAGVGATEAL